MASVLNNDLRISGDAVHTPIPQRVDNIIVLENIDVPLKPTCNRSIISCIIRLRQYRPFLFKFCRLICTNGVGVSCVGFVILVMFVSGVSSSCGFKADSSAGQSRQLSKPPALLRCGVDLYVTTSPCTVGDERTGIAIEAPSSDDVTAFLSVLEREVGLYPTDFFAKCGFRRMILCQNLKSERTNGGLFASCAPQKGEIYVDVARVRLTDRAAPRTIHHEIYHFVDYAVGQIVNDVDWVQLGESAIVGCSDGFPSANVGQPFGFVNFQSSSTVAEDKAEVFSMLMADPVLLDYYANRDPSIREKVEQIIGRVRLFCPSCNETFWSRVRQERMNDPSYSSYVEQVLRRFPVYLVRSSDALKVVALGSKSQNVQVEKLRATLGGPDINMLHTHSIQQSRAPFFELLSSEGQGFQSFLMIRGIVIADEEISPEILQEIIHREQLELPICLDLIYRADILEGESAFFIAVRRVLVPNQANPE